MSVTAPKGFRAAGIAAGIKATGEPDLALVAVAEGAPPAIAAAVFTTNLAAAAPVQLSRRHLAQSEGLVGAVIANSGCANAATGAAGAAAALSMAELASKELGVPTEQVLVCSTGVIGFDLPLAPLETGIPVVAASLAGGSEASLRAASALMTTDTRPKQVTVEGDGFVVGGIAKGAAMLAPNMATMLAILTTDAAVDRADLRTALTAAVGESFNELTIDGCTSTNDTVIVLASGLAAPATPAQLATALSAACRDLAHQMAADAEGGTKVVRVTVTGATDDESARRGARKIADANLVKCSWYGADPNWGRVVSELGSAGIGFDPDTVSVSYGPHTVCSNGSAASHDAEALAAYLAGKEIELSCELGLGMGRGSVLSADLTHGYIDENMGLS